MVCGLSFCHLLGNVNTLLSWSLLLKSFPGSITYLIDSVATAQPSAEILGCLGHSQCLLNAHWPLAGPPTRTLRAAHHRMGRPAPGLLPSPRGKDSASLPPSFIKSNRFPNVWSLPSDTWERVSQCVFICMHLIINKMEHRFIYWRAIFNPICDYLLGYLSLLIFRNPTWGFIYLLTYFLGERGYKWENPRRGRERERERAREREAGLVFPGARDPAHRMWDSDSQTVRSWPDRWSWLSRGGAPWGYFI